MSNQDLEDGEIASEPSGTSSNRSGDGDINDEILIDQYVQETGKVRQGATPKDIVFCVTNERARDQEPRNLQQRVKRRSRNERNDSRISYGGSSTSSRRQRPLSHSRRSGGSPSSSTWRSNISGGGESSRQVRPPPLDSAVFPPSIHFAPQSLMTLPMSTMQYYHGQPMSRPPFEYFQEPAPMRHQLQHIHHNGYLQDISPEELVFRGGNYDSVTMDVDDDRVTPEEVPMTPEVRHPPPIQIPLVSTVVSPPPPPQPQPQPHVPVLTPTPLATSTPLPAVTDDDDIESIRRDLLRAQAAKKRAAPDSRKSDGPAQNLAKKTKPTPGKISNSSPRKRKEVIQPASAVRKGFTPPAQQIQKAPAVVPVKAAVATQQTPFVIAPTPNRVSAPAPAPQVLPPAPAQVLPPAPALDLSTAPALDLSTAPAPALSTAPVPVLSTAPALALSTVPAPALSTAPAPALPTVPAPSSSTAPASVPSAEASDVPPPAPSAPAPPDVLPAVDPVNFARPFDKPMESPEEGKRERIIERQKVLMDIINASEKQLREDSEEWKAMTIRCRELKQAMITSRDNLMRARVEKNKLEIQLEAMQDVDIEILFDAERIDTHRPLRKPMKVESSQSLVIDQEKSVDQEGTSPAKKEKTPPLTPKRKSSASENRVKSPVEKPRFQMRVPTPVESRNAELPVAPKKSFLKKSDDSDDDLIIDKVVLAPKIALEQKVDPVSMHVEEETEELPEREESNAVDMTGATYGGDTELEDEDEGEEDEDEDAEESEGSSRKASQLSLISAVINSSQDPLSGAPLVETGISAEQSLREKLLAAKRSRQSPETATEVVSSSSNDQKEECRQLLLKLCKFDLNGRCTRGQECNFLHLHNFNNDSRQKILLEGILREVLNYREDDIDPGIHEVLAYKDRLKTFEALMHQFLGLAMEREPGYRNRLFAFFATR